MTDTTLAYCTACHPALAGRLCCICLPRDLTPSLGPFDGVYAVATLIHLTRPALQEFFSGIRRILVPGGCMYFRQPGVTAVKKEC